MKFSAIILAGGLSQRMGSPKALIPYRGKPLIQYSVDLATTVTAVTFISANGHDLDHLGFRVVPDIYPVKAPLAGIHAGLTASPHLWNLVLSCDMPGITRDLIRRLWPLLNDDFQIVVPAHHGFIEPLCGFYHKSLLPVIEANLQSGKYSLLDLIREASTRFLTFEADEEHTTLDLFRNINTQKDLEQQ